MALSGCSFPGTEFADEFNCLFGACDALSNQDRDGDGITDVNDNCATANANQSDGDRDGLGNACDSSSTGPTNPGRNVTSAAAAKGRFVLRFTVLRGGHGRVRAIRHGVAGRGGFAGGIFDATGPLAASRSNWRASYGFAIDSKLHRASVTGVALLDFPAPRSGRLCIAFSTRHTVTGKHRKLRTRGSMRTLGGSGAMQGVSAAGTYSSARNGDGTWTMRGRRLPGGRRGTLPRRCRALAAHL